MPAKSLFRFLLTQNLIQMLLFLERTVLSVGVDRFVGTKYIVFFLNQLPVLQVDFQCTATTQGKPICKAVCLLIPQEIAIWYVVRIRANCQQTKILRTIKVQITNIRLSNCTILVHIQTIPSMILYCRNILWKNGLNQFFSLIDQDLIHGKVFLLGFG